MNQRVRARLAASTAAVGCLGAAPIAAQTGIPASTPVEAVEQAPPEQTPSSDITVTATRTPSPFRAPTPTQVLGAEVLKQRGVTNICSPLIEQPAFNSRLSGAANGVRTATPRQTLAYLRGLGSARTLVLIDGRRLVLSVPASSVGNPYQVDPNLIPTLMIERADIVPDGASAQWGSDAVAGVVNLILRRKLDGLQGEIQIGISERGNGRDFRVSAFGGCSFSGDRGHVVLSADHSDSRGLGTYRARDWSDDSYKFLVDPTAPATNGRPHQVICANLQPGNFTPGSRIVNATGGTAAQRAALIGLQFDSATTVSPFVRGEFNPATTSTTFTVNQLPGTNPALSSYSMIPATRRSVFYGPAEYKVSDALTLFVDGSWGGRPADRPTSQRVTG